MELFVKRAPQQVVDAMRQTVANMIGTLPPQFFTVTVTTVAENLAQLMYSVLMTGYMFRNAQYQLELQQGLEQVALPEVQDKEDVPDYAPGTQKKVSGEVIRWNNISGPEKIDTVKYIELLEAEIEELHQEVGRKSANGQNELLESLRSLQPQNLKELTSSAGEDFVHKTPLGCYGSWTNEDECNRDKCTRTCQTALLADGSWVRYSQHRSSF